MSPTIIPTEKTATQIEEEHIAWVNSLPLRTACLFCDWCVETSVEEGRELADAHRREHHPKAKQRRRKHTNSHLMRFKQPAMKLDEATEVERERQKRAKIHGVEIVGEGSRLDSLVSRSKR